jgi:hypothetical protein
MSIVFKILHIPSGDFITAFKSSGYTSEVMFYDSISAIQFLGCVANQVNYISGGPIDDFYLGSVPITEYRPSPLLSEFELLPFELETLPEVEQHRVLHLTRNSNEYVEEVSNSILYH